MLTLLSDTLANGSGAVSPDGQWLAVSTDPSGRNEVYARRATMDDAVLDRVSASGGEDPVFSRTGRELHYRRGQDLMVATWQSDGDRFRVTGERVFARPDGQHLLGLDDVAMDGRLLVRVASPAPPAPQVRIVLSWAQELAGTVER